MSLVVLMAVLAAGCGLRTQRSPHVVQAARLPDPTPATVAPAGNAVVHLFFVGHDRLAEVVRSSQVSDVSEAVTLLLHGPTNGDVSAGLRTAIPTDTTLTNALPNGTVEGLELSQSFSSVAGQEQILAIAQLVFTATAVPGVTQVSFSIGGTPLEVPRGDGTLAPGPVSRADYGAVGPA
jgi:spore germination protein GerM